MRAGAPIAAAVGELLGLQRGSAGPPLARVGPSRSVRAAAA